MQFNPDVRYFTLYIQFSKRNKIVFREIGISNSVVCVIHVVSDATRTRSNGWYRSAQAHCHGIYSDRVMVGLTKTVESGRFNPEHPSPSPKNWHYRTGIYEQGEEEPVPPPHFLKWGGGQKHLSAPSHLRVMDIHSTSVLNRVIGSSVLAKESCARQLNDQSFVSYIS